MFLYLRVCVLLTCSYQHRPEEGIRSPGTGVAGIVSNLVGSGKSSGAGRAAPSRWTILPYLQMKSSHGKRKSQTEIPISERRQKRMIKYVRFRIICVIAAVGSQVQPSPFLPLFCLQELHIWISAYRRNTNRLLSDLMWWVCGSSMIEPMLTIPEVLGSNPSKKMKVVKNKRRIRR